MGIKETTEINKTQGIEEKIPCTSCNGKTFHKVLLSVDESGEEQNGNFDFNWNRHFQIIQCQGCKTISFRITSTNSEDYELDDEGCKSVVSEEIYPSRIEGRKGLDILEIL